MATQARRPKRGAYREYSADEREKALGDVVALGLAGAVQKHGIPKSTLGSWSRAAKRGGPPQTPAAGVEVSGGATETPAESGDHPAPAVMVPQARRNKKRPFAGESARPEDTGVSEVDRETPRPR